MSPASFHDRINIHGPRPSPLTIKSLSRPIQKQPSCCFPAAPTRRRNLTPKQERRPVIIYTQSPKIIHTKPRDFMALVQRLTGKDDEGEKDETRRTPVPAEETDDVKPSLERFPSLRSRITGTPKRFLSDMPIFTPTSADFYCSPRNGFRYPDMVSVSPKMGNLTSPSFMDFFRGIPDY